MRARNVKTKSFRASAVPNAEGVSPLDTAYETWRKMQTESKVRALHVCRGDDANTVLVVEYID